MTKSIKPIEHPAFTANEQGRTLLNADTVDVPKVAEFSDGIRLRSVHFRHPNDGGPARGYMWVLRTVNGQTRPIKVPVEAEEDDTWLYRARTLFLALIGGTP
jgi:hypothetical protein